MPALDAKVAAVIDRPSTNDEDEDELIAALENDDEVDALREQRLQQLHQEFAREKAMRASNFGTYSEIRDEKELMDLTTAKENRLCVVHFFKPDFGRCGVMDSHLEALATKHFDTRFLRINVDNAPFLVTKLKVQVLPCVLAFVDGVSTDRIIGFEGLSDRPDHMTTRGLETRLLRAGVLVRSKVQQGNGIGQSLRQKNAAQDEEDDDDWD